MSGYNQKTGIFELTQKKARFWMRRAESPFEKNVKFNGFMDLCAGMFKLFGFEIVKQEQNYLHVKATPEQVWEVLSGMPSNPERAAHYYRNPNPARGT